MTNLLRGIQHLYASVFYIIVIIGAIAAAYYTGNTQVVHWGLMTVIAFCMVVLVVAWCVGWLMENEG